jgi:hypothetical protein
MFSANARRRQGERRPCCTQCGRPLPSFRFLALAKGKIHRVDPDFGSTLTVSNRDSQSNCWVNWKIMGRPCEFQVFALRARPPPPPHTHTHGPGLPELTAADRPALCAGAQRHAHGGGPRARRAGGRCVLPAVAGDLSTVHAVHKTSNFKYYSCNIIMLVNPDCNSLLSRL